MYFKEKRKIYRSIPQPTKLQRNFKRRLIEKDKILYYNIKAVPHNWVCGLRSIALKRTANDGEDYENMLYFFSS